MSGRLTAPWSRFPGLSWVRVLGGALLVLVAIGVIPPLRRAAVLVTSKVILFVASPLAPSIASFDDLPEPSRVLAADGSELGTVNGTQRLDPMALARLPRHVRNAVLAAEDAEFYSHSGVDPSAIVRATLSNLAGRGEQGGSTITQQLAKLNYTGSQRTFLRKLREVLYATRLEREHTKDELLERYLNQVNFGYSSYGIAAGSKTFFGIPPEQLNPAQAATLAGKIRSPEGLDPARDPGAVERRRNQVLTNMRRHRWLTDAELQTARTAPLGVVPRGSQGTAAVRASHFVAYAAREASGFGELGASAEARGRQVYAGGYKIETTLDPKAFDAATATVKQQLGAPGDPTTAIVSVQPGDGAIRMLFGGLDASRQFDVASRGQRQPGSSFKPFVYLAGLEAGIDPRTTYESSSPMTLSCRGAPWTVRNYEGEGGGPRTFDDATTNSINTVYAQVMAKVGPDKVRDEVEKAGISHEEVTPAECAMALGGLRKGVTPLEQAAAFATFAAHGVYAKPYAVTRVTDRHGRVLYRHQTKTDEKIDRKKVGVLTAALEQVVKGGTGTAAAIGRPVAGKTGTTENYGNAWFIGYVPQLATSVWVGYPEGNVPMTRVHGISVSGGSFPARIFSSYMKAALAGVPVRDLERASPDELGLRKPDVAPPPTSAPAPTTPTSSAPATPTTSDNQPQFFPPATPVPTIFVPRDRPPPVQPTTTARRPPPTTSTTAPGG